MDEMDPIINEFLTESYENLDQLDQDLVDLEAHPGEQNLLASIFRTIHTIKGTCGFLGYSKLESVAHVGENLLSKLRDGELSINPEIANALLAMVDAVRQILGCIDGERNEGDVDYSKLVETLTALQNGQSVEVTPPVATATEPADVPTDNGATAEAPVASDTPSEETTAVAPANGNGTPAADTPAVDIPAEETPATAAEESAPATEDRRAGDRRQGGAGESIRVDVDLLDTLMNLVGELVLARNQIVQFSATEGDSTFNATSQHLNQLTSELQEGVMKTRMQPIGNIWSKFPRVVRDLSMSIGKQVRLEMEGKETELDKTLIEAIKDPLTHIVRNSVDHGIESPEVRKERGKEPEGRLLLRAYHEGGQVNIEIIDDGGGIDPERIKAKALEKNIISREQAGRMSDRELVGLIFHAGFSTAEKVSNISGRGVGMDVVKTNIEKIGGKVDINSTTGVGTTLKVKIPLTLAIIPALVVICGGNRYAIPQVSLLELVRLEGEQAKTAIERIQGAPVYRLRGNLLPLVYLNQQLGLDGSAAFDGAVNIVVLQADNRQFGLVVDTILDTEEIVVKPLSKQLKNITSYAGATIMGDGKVALILDVMGMAQKAHVITEQSRDAGRKEHDDRNRDDNGERQTLLIFTSGDDSRMAVPLSMVARLEEFKRDTIERSGEQDVVQYRGDIMPLIYLDDVFNNPRPEDGEHPMQVVVYSDKGRNVGVVVGQIVDIVEENITIKKGTQRQGIIGSTVVQNMVTDLLDVQGVIQKADPEFYSLENEESLVLAGSHDEGGIE